MKTETLNHCHTIEERGWQFHSEDSGTTEEEYLYLLYALVFSLKPVSILETGSYTGHGSVFMARALRRNGNGFLASIETDAGFVPVARKNVEVNEVSEYADIIEADSIEYLKHTTRRFDFAFFDSLLSLRCSELQICLNRGLLQSGHMFAIHDTSKSRILTQGNPDPLTSQYWEELEGMSDRIKWVQFPLSRGLTLGQVL